MSKRLDIQKTYKLFIGGKFPRSESGRHFQVTNTEGKHLANVCRSSRKDFRDAAVAARDALPGWSGKSGHNRGQILYRMAEMMEGRREQFIEEIRSQSGAGEKKAGEEVSASIDRLIYFAGWSDKFQQLFSTVNPVASSHFNFSRPEPTGVVAVLAPENSPLLGLITATAPVVVGGNTCVVLSSESAPLSAITFGEVLHSSDVPGGVINILTGYRRELISHISSHMDINAVYYNGQEPDITQTIQENASLNVKRVTLRNTDNWSDEKLETPYSILDFQEIKTTWHPVGV